NDICLLFQLFTNRNQWHHDFERHLLAFAFNLDRRFEDGAALHTRYFGIKQSQTATAESQHGVCFTNLVHVVQQVALLVDLVQEMIHLNHRFGLLQSHLQFGQLAQQLIDIRQELMQRRIEKANSHRKSSHLAEDADEVAPLQRQKLLQSFLAGAYTVGENHLAHRRQTLIAKEHVFGTAQTDAFGAKTARGLGIERRVGIRAYAQFAKLIGPLHQLVKI